MEDDYFRRAQENLLENTNKATNALDHAFKENCKWLSAIYCSMSLEIRRPVTNSKKRRLDLDLAKSSQHQEVFSEKRRKSTEEPIQVLQSGEASEDETNISNLSQSSRSSRAASRRQNGTRKINPFKLKVADLRKELKDRGLNATGLKATLIARLAEALDENRQASKGNQLSDIKLSDKNDGGGSHDDEIVDDSDMSTQDVSNSFNDKDALPNLEKDVAPLKAHSPETNVKAKPSDLSLQKTKETRDIASKTTSAMFKQSAEQSVSNRSEYNAIEIIKQNKKISEPIVVDLVSPEKQSIDGSEAKELASNRTLGESPPQIEETSSVSSFLVREESSLEYTKTNEGQKRRISPTVPSETTSGSSIEPDHEKLVEYSSPTKEKSHDSESPPESRKRKDSIPAKAPSPPKKIVKAVALFDSRVSPFLPRQNKPSTHQSSKLANSSQEKQKLVAEFSDVSPISTASDSKSNAKAPFESGISPIQASTSEESGAVKPKQVLVESFDKHASPRFGKSLTSSNQQPRQYSNSSSSGNQSSQTNHFHTFSHATKKSEDESVTVMDSDLLMSTAASLFASATSPIVKGFASFKSAFGLVKSKPRIDDSSNDPKEVKIVRSPSQRVPAQKIFQSRPRTDVDIQNSLKADINAAREVSTSQPKTNFEANHKPKFTSPVKKFIPEWHTPERQSSPVRINPPVARHGQVDDAQRELQETIEREAKRLRLAAKESAKKRIEEEKIGKGKTTRKLSISASPDVKSKKNENVDVVKFQPKQPHSPLSTDVVDDLEKENKSDEYDENASVTESKVVPKRPLNLVSGLHSFTALVENKSSQPTSQTSNSSKGAGPIVVSSLKMAERNRLAEQKRLLEKKKRKEALLKKYEDQRKQDEEKRKKIPAVSTKEQNENIALEIRAKREREFNEKKLREAELAKKKQNRLQGLQALDDKKKQQMFKEKEQRIKENVDRMRQEREYEGKKTIRHDHSVEVAVLVSSSTAKNVDSAKTSTAKSSDKNAIVGPTKDEHQAVALSSSSKQRQGVTAYSTKLVENSSMAKENISEKEHTNYEMSDGPESDDSGNSDDERKKIPNWAQRDALEDALARQFGPRAIDPTPSIFPDFVDTCDLEAIFQPVDSKKKKRFNKRTSSGNWLADKPTIREKVAYKRDMGFIN
ncbi:hypothetical protein Ae201684_009434 [Aphanomyces euteiches]|uniref:SAP domain-containing protein n=1 Tax=Aphanomyces euteiches TaxID=100861 RepID=A0A6G0X277_9STRA|nr:hypothetical protein Ae201684_009434 [Aphanomyces euteiches]KAH9140879.1 hypothetical protein AeRB84_014918 [Aphanomyces euteiches]